MGVIHPAHLAHVTRRGAVQRSAAVALAAAAAPFLRPAPARGAAPGAPEAATTNLPNGRFFTEANGAGGSGGTGFAIVDEAWSSWGDPPPLRPAFFSEFQRLGGVSGVGYPASRAFEWDGFVVQAMQKGVFQWRPETGRVAFVNVFDELHHRGLDDRLFAERQVPRPAEWSGDAALPWDEVVTRHLAVLDDFPRLRAAYGATPHPLELFGLPMSPVVDFGPFAAVRLQRAVLQQYRLATPYARPGDVLVVNGGDVAKDYGLVPDWAAMPHGVPRWSDRILVFVPDAGAVVGPTFRVVGDARVFEAQFRWEVRAADGTVLRGGPADASTCCEWARFLVDVDLTGVAPQPVRLVLFEFSPADGAPRGTVEVPLDYRA